MNEKRTFTKAEKLAILKEAGEQGVKATLERHAIYAATYYSWRKKFKEMGEVGLDHGMNKHHLKRIRDLERENQKLKELVAEKELVVRMHEEIKKRWALEKKSKR